MGHSKGEIKTLSSDGRSVNAGENMRLGFLTKRVPRCVLLAQQIHLWQRFAD